MVDVEIKYIISFSRYVDITCVASVQRSYLQTHAPIWVSQTLVDMNSHRHVDSYMTTELSLINDFPFFLEGPCEKIHDENLRKV